MVDLRPVRRHVATGGRADRAEYALLARTDRRVPTYVIDMNEEPRTLVIITKRHLDGLGRCRRCGHPVAIDDRVAWAITLGAAMLCSVCSTLLYEMGRQFDPADVLEADD